MKKTPLVLSAVLTVFTLLILSGVAYSVKQSQQDRQALAAEIQAAPSQNIQDPSQDFAGREAAYRELIQQANRRLEKAQAEIQRLQAQSGQAQGAQAQDAPGAVSIEQAAQIAAAAAGQTEIYSAESILIDGRPAFQITFSSGDLAFVNPEGQVLSIQPASRELSGSSTGGDGDHEEYEDDHEDGEHEEFEGEHEEFEMED